MHNKVKFVAFFWLAAILNAQQDWPVFGGDPGAQRHSTLRQISTANVAKLQAAWTFRAGKPGSEAIPIVTNGVMYVTAPDGVYAIVPETGDLLWKYNAIPVALRGLAYWAGAGGLGSIATQSIALQWIFHNRACDKARAKRR